MEIAIGDAVLIMGDNKNRDKWNFGILEELCEDKEGWSEGCENAKDDIIRAIKLLSRKKFIERPIQFFYRLE